MKRPAICRAALLASVVLVSTRQVRAQSAFTTFPSTPYAGSDGVTPGANTTYTYYAPNYVGQGTLVPPTAINSNNGFVALNNLVGSKNVSGGGSVQVNSSWEYSPSGGVSVAGYYTANSSGGHLSATVAGVSSVGQVIGYSNHYNASPYNGSAGTDAWIATPGPGGTSTSQLLPGLTGTNYNWTSSYSGFISKSQPSFISSGGAIVGVTARDAGAGNANPSYGLGQAAWYYNPNGGSTTEIGLHTLPAGGGTNPANYSGNAQIIANEGLYYNETNVGLSSAGWAAGTANEYLLTTTGTYTNSGVDGWVYSPTTGTTAIGLFQSGLTPVGYQGGAYSYSKMVSNSLGLARTTNILAVNSKGQVGGSSYLYNSANAQVGGEAFVYTPGSGGAGTYSLRGFTTDGLSANPPATVSYVGTGSFAGQRSSFLYYLNDGGQSVGISQLYSNDGSVTGGPAQAGTDLWFATATGAQTRLGLSGSIYTNNLVPQNAQQPPLHMRVSTPTQLTQSGLVGGISNRYLTVGTQGSSHNGQDAFVYDSATGTTYPVASSYSLADTTASSSYVAQIVQLTNNGYAVGSWGYTTSTNAFFWSPASGFIDLSYYAPVGSTLSNVFYTSSDASTLYADLTSGSNVTIAKISVAYVWGNTGSGDWGDETNWTNGMVPGSASSNPLVVLGSTNSSGAGITSPSTVNLSSTATIGALTFSNTNAYTLSSNNGSALTISGVYLGGLTVTSGSHLVSVPVTFASNTAVSLAAGTSLELSGPVSGSGNLQIGGGGIAGAGGGTLVLGDTSNYTGIINLASGDLVLKSANLSSVNAAVTQSYAGGTWQGSGAITSSAAANDTTHLISLGVIQNSTNGSPSGPVLYASFGGTAGRASTDVLLKNTYFGDTNLDGKVDGSDYSRIDAAYLTQSGANPLTGWFNGDFNYDGVVNGSDYTLIDNAFNSQGVQLAAMVSVSAPSALTTAQLASAQGSFIQGSSSVPEPASIGLIVTCAAGLLSRRSFRRGMNG